MHWSEFELSPKSHPLISSLPKQDVRHLLRKCVLYLDCEKKQSTMDPPCNMVNFYGILHTQLQWQMLDRDQTIYSQRHSIPRHCGWANEWLLLVFWRKPQIPDSKVHGAHLGPHVAPWTLLTGIIKRFNCIKWLGPILVVYILDTLISV